MDRGIEFLDSLATSDFALASPAPSSRAKPVLSLFVACYNEEENIFSTLSNIRDACHEVGISYEIVVIDDASVDNSVGIISAWTEENPDVVLRLTRKDVNCGLSANYIEASRLATGEWFRLICGDDVEPKETLVAVFREIGNAEILIPYHIKCPGKPVSRLLISSAYTLLINLVSGNWVRYYNGLPVMRRQYASLYSERDLGFGFQAALLAKLLSLRLSFLQIPVKTHERVGGAANALTKRNFVGVLKVVWRIFVRRFQLHPEPISVPVVAEVP